MKQPEALRLADFILSEPTKPKWDTLYEVSAELRRLHEANQAMLEALKAIRNSAYMPSALVVLIDLVIENGEQK